MQVGDIFQQIDNFSKLAGLLKVPEQFTKEVSDWAISVFSSRMLLVIDRKLEKIANENSIGAEIENILSSQEAGMITHWSSAHFRKHLSEKDNSILLEYNDHRAAKYYFKLWLFFEKGKYNINFETQKQNIKHDNLSQAHFEKILNPLLIILRAMLDNLREIYEDMIPTRETLVELYLLKKLCQNYIKEDINIDETSYLSKTFDINVNELPYLTEKDLEKIVETSFDITTYYVQTQQAADAINGEIGQWKGMWHHSSIYIYVNYNKLSLFMDEVSFKEKVADIRQIIRHEIQHAMQQFVSRFKNMKEDIVGYPSSKYQEKIDPSEDYITKYYATEHELRDVEFYTNLSDNIIQFKEQLKLVPSALYRDYARMWINDGPIDEFPKKMWAYYKKQFPNKLIDEVRNIIRPQAAALKPKNALFYVLKEKSPDKYLKAVKIFWAQIGSLL